jgi:hypothetical protein
MQSAFLGRVHIYVAPAAQRRFAATRAAGPAHGWACVLTGVVAPCCGRTHYGTTYGEEISEALQTATKAHAVSEGMRPTLCYEKQAQLANRAGTRKPSKELGYQTLNTSMQMKNPDVRASPSPLPRHTTTSYAPVRLAPSGACLQCATHLLATV